MKKVLIIGGDSFIAGQFIKGYSTSYDLTVISRKNTGLENEIIVEDFSSVPDACFKSADVVINFAAIVHRPEIKDEDLYKQVNYQLPVLLANKALENDVQHFVQLSTIAVYGNSAKINAASVCAPQDFYGLYKLKADISLLEISKNTPLQVSIIRPSMVYGGGRAPGNMLKLIGLINKKYPLPFKNLKNKRQFLHVANLCYILQYVIEEKYPGIILAADPEAVSTEYLVKTISEILGFNVRLFNSALPKRIISLVNPKIYNSLFENLEIEITLPYAKITNKKPYTLVEGLMEMIKPN
jgi:UDP-glucose 4-epimerase